MGGGDPMGGEIGYLEYLRVDVRVGEVVRVEPFERARKPAWKLWIDFGELGVRRSSAQLTGNYTPEVLLGRQVLAVVNFAPKQIADFMSEVLVLGVPDAAGHVVLVAPDGRVPNGGRLY
jgi:tRNA-binding protein